MISFKGFLKKYQSILYFIAAILGFMFFTMYIEANLMISFIIIFPCLIAAIKQSSNLKLNETSLSKN